MLHDAQLVYEQQLASTEARDSSKIVDVVSDSLGQQELAFIVGYVPLSYIVNLAKRKEHGPKKTW